MTDSEKLAEIQAILNKYAPSESKSFINQKLFDDKLEEMKLSKLHSLLTLDAWCLTRINDLLTREEAEYIGNWGIARDE